MPTINLGVVAHVDAGKTTLTERLLYETGVIAQIGRVDHGDTATDTDVLERRRGITIRSAVVSFSIGATKVNLIDTPGHSDFVAEVERAFAVLDGAVLVVSAVEGVQAQTRVLVRILERLRLPFLIFVNKIDRVGAAHREVLEQLDEALGGTAIAVTEPYDVGTRAAGVLPRSGRALAQEVLERLAEGDDSWLGRYVDGRRPLDLDETCSGLRLLTRACSGHPTFFGAALLGTGVDEVLAGIGSLLPPAAGDPDAPLHATVFKIERTPTGRQSTYLRLHSGRLASRDRVERFRARGGEDDGATGRVTAVRTYVRGTEPGDVPAAAGDIALVAGLDDLQIGDQLGRWEPSAGERQFPPPGLAAVVRPRAPGDRSRLFDALRLLSAQDPLIDARLDGLDEEPTVSLYGEVQKEVLAAKLSEEFGIGADFLPTAAVCVERVAGVGEGVAAIGGANAIVGLRVEPGRVESGLSYRLAVERGWLLPSYHTAIEETLRSELRRGLHGWRVEDATVTLIEAHFEAPTPPAGFFRRLTTTTFREALRAADTVVCEPWSEFEADVPAASFRAVLGWLIGVRAVPNEPELRPTRCRISGVLPTAEVNAVEQRLPGLTQGRGAFFATPTGFRPSHASGASPSNR